MATQSRSHMAVFMMLALLAGAWQASAQGKCTAIQGCSTCIGALYCFRCNSGWYSASTLPGSGKARCLRCPIPTTSTIRGPRCIVPAGKYSPTGAQVIDCPPGTFSASPREISAAGSCSVCPEARPDSPAGSTSSNQCGCAPTLTCTALACIPGVKVPLEDVTCYKGASRRTIADDPVAARHLALVGVPTCAGNGVNVTLKYTDGSCTVQKIVGSALFVRPQVRLQPAAKLVGSVCEQVVFDDAAKLIYAIGTTIISTVPTPFLRVMPAPGFFEVGSTAPVAPLVSNDIDLSQLAGVAQAGAAVEVTDVQVCGGFVAIATAYKEIGNPAWAVSSRPAMPGKVHFFVGGSTPTYVSSATVGHLPDQIEWSDDCKTMLVAGEGEPNYYGPTPVTTPPTADAFDPEGSVAIITVDIQRPSGGTPTLTPTVFFVPLSGFNGQQTTMIANGIRLIGPGASVVQDLETEYVTFSADNSKAYVIFQDNNAMGVIDVATKTIEGIFPLGYKDHSLAENSMDGGDRDSPLTPKGPYINIQAHPGLVGMYMPDEAKSFSHDGKNFVVTANEGDAKDAPGIPNEDRVVNLFDAGNAPPNVTADVASVLQLGRLTVTTQQCGANGGDLGAAKCARLQAFGARSFSVWNVDNGVKLEYDSKNELELKSSQLLPTLFNSEGTTASFDGRSDNKGPEPEGVAIAMFRFKPLEPLRRLLFLTLERLGQIAVYDISNPTAAYGTGPEFQSFNAAVDGILQPEGITFAMYTTQNGTKVPMVFVAFEGTSAGVSGGMAAYEVVGQ